jgi:hypothetical protein
MNRRAQLICAWTGPVLTVLFLIGAVLLGRFIPPWVRPGYGAQKVAHIFAQHHGRILAGAFVSIISAIALGSERVREHVAVGLVALEPARLYEQLEVGHGLGHGEHPIERIELRE